jgi:hypothetical protein
MDFLVVHGGEIKTGQHVVVEIDVGLAGVKHDAVTIKNDNAKGMVFVHMECLDSGWTYFGLV